MKMLYVAGGYPFGCYARREHGSIKHMYKYFRTREARDAWIAEGQGECASEPEHRYAAAEEDVADCRYEQLLRR